MSAFFCGEDGGWSQHADIDLVDGGFGLRAKNSADFMLAFHAGEVATRGTAAEVAIVSGDDGFAVVAKSLRSAGITVYAVIPCGAGTYGVRLADAVNLALLVPLPTEFRDRNAAPVVNTAVNTALARFTFKTLEHARLAREIGLAMAGCRTDRDGWMQMGELGQEVARAGLSLGNKKLSEVLVLLDCFEFGVANQGQTVRLKPVGPAAISAPTAAG